MAVVKGTASPQQKTQCRGLVENSQGKRAKTVIVIDIAGGVNLSDV